MSPGLLTRAVCGLSLHPSALVDAVKHYYYLYFTGHLALLSQHTNAGPPKLKTSI